MQVGGSDSALTIHNTHGGISLAVAVEPSVSSPRLFGPSHHLALFALAFHVVHVADQTLVALLQASGLRHQRVRQETDFPE